MDFWRLAASAGAAIGMALLLALPEPQLVSAQTKQVDLALVLAIDCSFSVDSNEFRQQMVGLGEAFQSREVKDAINKGPAGRIAVAAIQWSDDRNQMIIVPWTEIASEADADALGEKLKVMPRQLAEGGTSISSALMFSAALLSEAPVADRKVVDMSSDGRNNTGPPVSAVRDRLVSSGITINAVTILNEWPTLDKYFENNVVGGQAHFVIVAENYQTYAEAILRKLVREITGPGIS